MRPDARLLQLEDLTFLRFPGRKTRAAEGDSIGRGGTHGTAHLFETNLRVNAPGHQIFTLAGVT